MAHPEGRAVNANELREPRIGCMVHFTRGHFATDAAYCRDPASKVSYNLLIGPDGDTDLIVPWDLRAWHAGVCRPSPTSRHYGDANSAFYGIALAGGPEIGPPTSAQEQTLNEVLFDRFREHQWSVAEWWRIQGHESEAYPPGRKDDPSGSPPSYGLAHPWLSLDGVRKALSATQP
jgi:N-acetyl-anhydromuramyl-L-alanine amidase AmpD